MKNMVPKTAKPPKESIDEIRAMFAYDPSTGSFQIRPRKCVPHMRPGGFLGPTKHMEVNVRKNIYAIKVLIWGMHYGTWPDRAIYYKNGDPKDLSIENLALVPTPKKVKDVTKEMIEPFYAVDEATGKLNFRQPTFAVKKQSFCAAGGYAQTNFLGVVMYDHHLVFMLTHGRPPSGVIDHINGDRRDNRPANLREADFSQNVWNQKKRTNSKSPAKGIHTDGARYYPRVCVNGVRHTFGSYDSLAEAQEVRRKAVEELHGEFVNHG